MSTKRNLKVLKIFMFSVITLLAGSLLFVSNVKADCNGTVCCTSDGNTTITQSDIGTTVYKTLTLSGTANRIRHTYSKNGVQQTETWSTGSGSKIFTPTFATDGYNLADHSMDYWVFDSSDLNPVYCGQSKIKYTCSAGKYHPSGTTCVNVGVGYYSAANIVSRTAISSGYYGNCSSDGNCATSSGQTICPAGSSCASGVRSSCATGTYQASTGQTTCSNSGAGYYVSTTGATARSACGGNNYYCPNSSNSSTTTVTAGYYSTGGTSTTRTGQSACGGNNYYCSAGVQNTVTAGYYSTGGTSTTRTGQTQCEAGNYCASGVKYGCGAGTYQSSPGQTSCLTTDAGYYASGSANSSQTDCGSDDSYSSAGASSCTTVTAGYYSTGGTSTTRTGETQCEENNYCVSGIKTPCATGYTSLAGATSCTDSTAPTTDSVTVSSNNWKADNIATYTVTYKASDIGSSMTGGAARMRILIFQDTRWTNARGYFAWDADGYVWAGDNVACTGGGYASKDPANYGFDTMTMTGCTTSVSGDQRTVTLTLRPNTNAGDLTGMDISMYVTDSAGNNSAWTDFNPNFTIDGTAPTMHDMTVNGVSKTIGETLRIYTVVSENVSGLNYSRIYIGKYPYSTYGWNKVSNATMIYGGTCTGTNAPVTSCASGRDYYYYDWVIDEGGGTQLSVFTYTWDMATNRGQYAESSTVPLDSWSISSCPAGQYNNGTNCVNAGAGYYSAANNDSRAQCTAGYYGSSTNNSTSTCNGQCTAGYYCLEGSISATQNICQAGYYCPTGTASETQNICPANKTSLEGSDDISDCKWVDGQSCTIDGDCYNNNCDTDFDSVTKYCHATATSCPNDTSEYATGYELCSSNSYYKSCSSSVWGSQQNSPDTANDYCDAGDGVQSGYDLLATCSSGATGGFSNPSCASCLPYKANTTSSCKTSCTSISDCWTGYYCNGSNQCLIDNTAPVVPAPTDIGVYTNSTSLTFSGTPSDADSGLSDCEGRVDQNKASAWDFAGTVGVDGDHTWTGTSGNTYYYQYRCQDTVGNWSNWSSWTDGITIDTTAPVVPAPTDEGVSRASVSLTFNGTPSDERSGISDCEGRIDQDKASTWDFAGSVGTDGDHTWSGIDGKTYYYQYRCQDIAGNWSGWSAWTDGISTGLDTDADGIPNIYETANGMDINNAADALQDWDGDGVRNLYEYLNGTNINDVNSAGFAPTGLSGIAIGESAIYWRWTRGNITSNGIEIYDGSDILIATLEADAREFVEVNLTGGTSYSRKVKEKYDNAWFTGVLATATTEPAIGSTKSQNPDIQTSKVEFKWYNTSDITFTSADLNVSPKNIDKYQYIWNQSSTITSTTLDNCAEGTTWDTSSLAKTLSGGSNYLHVIVCNSDTVTVAGITTYGPYNYDATVPIISSVEIENGATYTNSALVEFSFVASDTGGAGIDKMQFKVDGGSETEYENYVPYKTAVLTEGSHTISIRVKDEAGNESSWSTNETIVVDTSAPVMGTITSKTDSTGTTINTGDKFSDNQPYFSWSATDAQSGIEGYSIALDSEPNDTIDTTATFYEYTVTQLSEGSHTLKIKAKNQAGDWSDKINSDESAIATFTYTVDTVSPTLNITFPTNGGKYSTSTWLNISGTASDTTSGVQKVEVSIQNALNNYWNGSSFVSTETWNNAGTTTWTYNTSIANISDGNYTINFRASDNSEKADGTYNQTTGTRTITIDKSGPTFTSSNISPSSGIIKESTRPIITTEVGATVYICFKGASNSTSDGKADADCVTEGDYTSHAVDSVGKYTFVSSLPLMSTPVIDFYVKDSAGNGGVASVVEVSYQYLATLTTLNPNSASVGTSVTLSGQGFGSEGKVYFKNGASTYNAVTSVTSWSNTSITVNIPSDAITGNVYVETDDGINSNTITLTVIKAPQSIVFAPSSDIDMIVGESKIFAAYAKDEVSGAGNVVSGVGYKWKFSGLYGTVTGKNLNSTLPYSLTLTGLSNVETETIGSIITLKVTGASVGTISVSVLDLASVPDPELVVTVYDSVSSSNVSCSESGSIRLDFTSENLSTPDGIDDENTTAEHTNIKQYTVGSDTVKTVKINNYVGTGLVMSEDLYSGSEDIHSLLLTKNDKVEGNGTIIYEVTFDGTNWTRVTPGTAITDATGGTTIKWRATMSGTTNPTLYWVSMKISTDSLIEKDNIPEGNYVYAVSNCNDSYYQIGTVEELESGILSAKVQGAYLVKGNKNNYEDPGPIGIYDGETNIALIDKFLNY